MAVEILRPNAAGDECNISLESGEGCPNHYQNVDEAESDGDATRVVTKSSTYERDLYNLDNHSSGAGTINHITVYAVARYHNNTAYIKLAIKSGTGSGDPDTVSEGSEQTLLSGYGDYRTYSEQWSTNPATGSAWTWDEIDRLQAGIALKGLYAANYYAMVTQVYVEVDYTAVTGKTSSDTGSGSDAKSSGSPLALLSKTDSGSGAEPPPAQEALLAASETGSGAEALLSLVGKLVSDAGSGIENSYLDIIGASKSSSDSGSGADEAGLFAEFECDDSGSGDESLLTRLLRHRDTGWGSGSCLSLLTALIGTETGLGVDSHLAGLLVAGDAGLGIDRLLGRKAHLIDSGSGVEAAAIYKILLAADSGVGFEALSGLLALITASEVGSGSERLGAKVMTSPGAGDIRLPPGRGKTRIPVKGAGP